MASSTPGAGTLMPRILNSSARRRATKACIACRSRKVRCDVTVKGTPCTNCHLDDKRCEVKDRASRRRLPRKDDMEHIFDSTYPPSMIEENNSDHSDQAMPLESIEEFSNELGDSPIQLNDCESSFQGPEQNHTDSAGTVSHLDGDAAFNTGHELQGAEDATAFLTLYNFETMTPTHESIMPAPSTVIITNVSYSSYDFLTISNLIALSSQDLAFLKVKGCLEIPPKPILDEFMRNYFLYVHPFLPLIDEGEFWRIYNRDPSANPEAKIPLLIFQAMLFASCSYVPEAITKNLGYSQVRLARSAFYQKAKLLYDFSTEISSKIIAQAALLMTLASPPELQPIQSNSMWLKIALHHARLVNAHMAWDSHSPIISLLSQQDLRMLKRLWWCCLIRDRFLSLGLRRSVQVARSYPVLRLSDFQNEMDSSEVSSPEMKQRLIRILLRVMRLCNILTDVLLLIWPLDDDVRLNFRHKGTLADCKESLRTWHKKTQSEVSSMNQNVGLRQHSVIVHTNLMYMFYYASRLVIPHQEVLISCCQSREKFKSTNYDGHSGEVQEAVVGTIECLNELLQLDLARYLPLSAMAFTTMPLLLNVLDAKFISPPKVASDAEIRNHRLHVLIEAMKEYHPHYDGVEWIGYAVRHVVNLAQLDSSFQLNKLVSKWTDLLTQQPNFYLRLTLTIELTLSRNKIPSYHDVPEMLKGIMSPRISAEPDLPSMKSFTDQGVKATEMGTACFELIAEPLRDNITLGATSQPQNAGQPHILSDGFNFEDDLLRPILDFAGKDGELIFDHLTSGAPQEEDTITVATNTSSDRRMSNSSHGPFNRSCNINETVDYEGELDLLIAEP